MNILTFDLEDWFHILDFEETQYPEQWSKFENRIEKNTERILELLERKNVRATFFCLGWVAQQYPKLVQKISLKHELACHSMDHQLLHLQNREQFKVDLRKSVSILEDLTGKKVNAYRAPGFSLTRDHAYVFEELNQLGIGIDCSIFPAKRNHGGISDFPFNRPCIIAGSDFEILEFPLNTVSFLSKKIVFSGGGYFRLLPYSFIRSKMKSSDYVMTYFHPRDFDPGQPKLNNLSLRRRFMSYVGLNSSFRKLEMLLNEFEFTNIEEAAKLIDRMVLEKVKF